MGDSRESDDSDLIMCDTSFLDPKKRDSEEVLVKILRSRGHLMQGSYLLPLWNKLDKELTPRIYSELAVLNLNFFGGLECLYNSSSKAKRASLFSWLDYHLSRFSTDSYLKITPFSNI